MNLVRLDADIDGKQHLLAVEVNAGIDRSITADCDVMPSGEESLTIVNVSTSKLFAELGTVQTNKFTKPPVDVTLNVGELEGKKLSLPMYTVDASYSMMLGSYELKNTLVSRNQKLSSLQTYIYTSTPGVLGEDSSTPAAPLSSILKTVLELMIKRWGEGWEAASKLVTPESKKIIDIIHANNLKVLDIWYSILAVSDVATDVTEINEAALNTIEHLYAWVTRVYLSKAEDFTAIIDTFLSGLNLMYIPPLNGRTDYGSLVNKDAVMATPISKVLIIDGTASRFRPSASLPVTSVVVEAPGAIQVLATGDVAQGPPALILVSWPEAGASLFGKVQRIAPPPWLAESTDAATPIPSRQDTETGPLDATATRPAFEAQVTAIVNTQKDLTKILSRWAKQAYIDSTIKFDGITVRTPLDVSWEIGTRYELSSYKDGVKLFTGFLAEITHNIEKSSSRKGYEGSAEATTTLVFTHVEAGAFKLPNSGYE